MKIDGTEVMDNAAWASVAYSAAKKIIARKYRAKPFLAEQLLWHVINEIGMTYDFRVFGGVIRSLSNDGFIRSNGYAAARTSNGSGKKVWVKVPNWSKL